MLDKQAGLERVMPNKPVLPKSPVTGMNTKILGRVAPVKPVKQEVVKQAAERDTVERKAVEKVACEKVASATTSEIIRNNVIGTVASVGGVMALNAIANQVSRLVDQAAYKKSFEKALQLNPRLAAYDRGQLEEYFNLIAEASPSVARNPLLANNYLEYLLNHQGQINYGSYGNLVNLEQTIISNKNNTNPINTSAQKAIVEGGIRGTFDLINKSRDEEIHKKYRQQYDAEIERARERMETEKQRYGERQYNSGYHAGVKHDDLGALV